MKTALITFADDKFARNLEDDFLPTLRGPARYNGPVFVMYYGKDKNFIKKIGRKFNAKFVNLDKGKKATVFNQRYIDLPKIFDVLPKDIGQLMLIDGDIWFQKPISEMFEITKDNYGFVEEDFDADKDFNKGSILRIKNEKIREDFLGKMEGHKLISAGMLVGNRKKIESIVKEVNRFLKETAQDYFGLDQSILNYLIRSDKNGGIKLAQEYNYSLMSKQNKFIIKDGLLYDEKKELISVVHNSGGRGRLFPNGRKDISNISVIKKNLPGTFWGITTFFNPANYKNKIANYRRFREASRKQGLRLLTVECAFGRSPFKLKNDDADMLLRVRTDSVLWQKERLLNIGLKSLPGDCDKFAWLDADIIFLNNNWVKETADLLNSYAIVQPFSTYVRLQKEVFEMSAEELEKTSFGSYVDADGKRFFGVGYKVAQLGKRVLSKTMKDYGHAGLAWAARRDIFQENGLFDKSILSAADMLMAHLFYKNKLSKDCDYYVASSLEKYLYEWSEKIYPKVKGSIYYTDGALLHLWHGVMEKRNHEECKKILDKFSFSLDEDIKIDANGCWTWSSNKPGLHKAFKKYFYTRKEENSFLTSAVLIFYSLTDLFLKFRHGLSDLFLKFRHGLSDLFLKFRHGLFLKFDRGLGLLGLFLKKYSPSIYTKLKRIENILRTLIR